MHPQIRWILSRQALIALLAAAIAGLTGGGHSALSALIGGLIGVLGNAGYVWRAMRLPSGSDPVRIYRAQAAGEAFKYAVTLGLFALVFMEYREVAALPLFLGFGSTIAIHWLALLKQR